MNSIFPVQWTQRTERLLAMKALQMTPIPPSPLPAWTWVLPGSWAEAEEQRKGQGTDPVTWLNSYLKQEKKKNTGNNNSLHPLHLWPREACLPGFCLCMVCSTHISSLEAEPVMILAHHCVLMVPQNPTCASRQHSSLDRAQTRHLMCGVRKRQTWHTPTCHVRRPAEGWDGFQALLTTTSSIIFPRNRIIRNMILPLILLSRKLGPWINNTSPYIPNLLVGLICSMQVRLYHVWGLVICTQNLGTFDLRHETIWHVIEI